MALARREERRKRLASSPRDGEREEGEGAGGYCSNEASREESQHCFDFHRNTSFSKHGIYFLSLTNPDAYGKTSVGESPTFFRVQSLWLPDFFLLSSLLPLAAAAAAAAATVFPFRFFLGGGEEEEGELFG